MPPEVTTTPDGHLGTPDRNTFDNEGRLILQAPLATTPVAAIGDVLTVVGIDLDSPSPTKAVFELRPTSAFVGPIATPSSVSAGTSVNVGTNPADGATGVNLSNGILNGIRAESDPAGADVSMIYVEAGTNRVVMGDPARETFMPATRSSITYGPLHAGLVDITSDAAAYTWTEAELGHRVALITGLTSAKTQRWDTAAGSVDRAALVINRSDYGYTLVRADGGGAGAFIPARGQVWVYSDASANGGLGEIYANNPSIFTFSLLPLAQAPTAPPVGGGAFLYLSEAPSTSSAVYTGALITYNGGSVDGSVVTVLSPAITATVGSRTILDKQWERGQTADAVPLPFITYTLPDNYVGNFTVMVTGRVFAAGVYSTGFVKKIEAGVRRTNAGVATLVGAVAVPLNVDDTGLALDATVTVAGNNVVVTVVGAALTTVVWDTYLESTGRTTSP